MAITTVTTDNFETEVLKSDKKVVVDFWATWCGPCQMLSPVIEALSEEIDTIKFCKVNVDEQQDLAAKFSVMTIPTLIVFENGEIKDKSIGVQSKEDIKKMLGVN